MLLKTDEIIFRDDLYPRIETNPVLVQKYAETLDVVPPIEVNQRNELIDGWHRWTAHKKEKEELIEATVTQTKSDAQLLEFAIERNSSHGWQLTQDDKSKMARSIYHANPRQETKDKLVKILSVSSRTVSSWLSRMDKDLKAERNKKITGMWLACHTQNEIAEACGCPQQTVNDVILPKIADLQKSVKPAMNHDDGEDKKGKPIYTVPIYNVWKQQKKTDKSKHFGNSDSSFVDNLLYLYTKPLDIVVDPFAGSGSTIDICKKRFRRYWVSDLNPIVEREKDIRQLDITTSMPSIPRWKDVKLVYLDPPYWKQAQGEYSDAPQDLSNMELEGFTNTMVKIIRNFSKKMESGHIAMIIQPTQWKAPEKKYTDHIIDITSKIKLNLEMRFQAPYESQQCSAQMVDWAKENKKPLVLSREIVVWSV